MFSFVTDLLRHIFKEDIAEIKERYSNYSPSMIDKFVNEDYRELVFFALLISTILAVILSVIFQSSGLFALFFFGILFFQRPLRKISILLINKLS